MLRGSTVVDLLNAIVPLYLCIALGYASSKLRLLPHAQTYAGIGGFVGKFSIPFLVFRMISTNDPYHMDLKLIAADTVYKVAVLFVLCLTCFYRPTHQSLAWVSSLFNLATMPNSVLIGTPLLTSLYPGTAKDVTTLVFMQCLLWFSVCILILEVHKAVYENSKESEAKDLIVTDHQQEVSLSARETQQQQPGAGPGVADGLAICIPQDVETDSEGPLANYAQKGLEKVRPAKRQVAKKIAQTVFLKFLWAPIVWGSILGFIYSLLNFNMNMGVTPKLFACGIPKALLGVGVRFIVAPACMAVVSFAVGLRGNIFRFAVMQAMVPQAILSFVWASQYNVHVDIFSTAVWFQTAIFFPFAIALNTLLGLGS